MFVDMLFGVGFLVLAGIYGICRLQGCREQARAEDRGR